MSTVVCSKHVATAKTHQTRVVVGGDRIAATDTQVELAHAGDVEAAKFSKIDITINSSSATVVNRTMVPTQTLTRISGLCQKMENCNSLLTIH